VNFPEEEIKELPNQIKLIMNISSIALICAIFLLNLVQSSSFLQNPQFKPQCFRQESNQFKMTADGDGQKQDTILVIGGTGKLGRFVVEELVSRGYGNIRCLARNLEGEPVKALSRMPGVSVIQGDVTDRQSVRSAVQGCKACICSSGPRRMSKISDLWTAPDGQKEHPYELNYRGIQGLAEELKAAGGTKLVRVTGLSVGMSPFSVIATLLNLVISMAVKWQLYGEMGIRASGLDYTVIRPGGLSKDSDVVPEGYCLALADDGGVPEGKTETRIGRADVAKLCVECLNHPNAKNSTFGVLWRKDPEGPQQWLPLLESAKPDRSKLVPKPFSASVRAVVSAFFITALLTAKNLVQSFI